MRITVEHETPTQRHARKDAKLRAKLDRRVARRLRKSLDRRAHLTREERWNFEDIANRIDPKRASSWVHPDWVEED